MIKADWEATARAQAEEIGRLRAETESTREQHAAYVADAEAKLSFLRTKLEDYRRQLAEQPRWDATSAAVFTRMQREEVEHRAVIETMQEQETALQRSLAESQAEVERLRGLCGEAGDLLTKQLDRVHHYEAWRAEFVIRDRLLDAAKGEGA